MHIIYDLYYIRAEYSIIYINFQTRAIQPVKSIIITMIFVDIRFILTLNLLKSYQ